MKDHFNPLREPGINFEKTCPYCNRPMITMENTPSTKKYFCANCGKVFDNETKTD